MDEERHMNILYGLERGANLVKGGRSDRTGAVDERIVNVPPTPAPAAAAAAPTGSAPADE